MEIAVQCFGPARQLAGADVVMIELPDAATVGDAVDALASGHDELASLLPSCAIAVADEIVARSHPLHAGDEVAVLPPVAGG